MMNFTLCICFVLIKALYLHIQSFFFLLSFKYFHRQSFLKCFSSYQVWEMKSHSVPTLSLVSFHLICTFSFSPLQLGRQHGMEERHHFKGTTSLPTLPLALAWYILYSWHLPVIQLFACSLHTLEVTLRQVLVCKLK